VPSSNPWGISPCHWVYSSYDLEHYGLVELYPLIFLSIIQSFPKTSQRFEDLISLVFDYEKDYRLDEKVAIYWVLTGRISLTA
jgi:hypothetical protein